MNPITWLKQYTQELQEQISGLNKWRCVVDDSQLIHFLSEHQQSDNNILMSVIPDFGTRARDIDNAMLTPSTAFYVLKKTDYSSHNHDEFLDIFIETFDQCQDIVTKMLNDATQGCEVIRYLKPESITITPVWGKASCNGWVINVNLDYPI